MKVLVTVRRSPAHGYLVKVKDKSLIEEVKSLVSLGRHTKAVLAVLTRGSLIKEVNEDEIAHLETDLILTERSANWDRANASRRSRRLFCGRTAL